jgi:hypothetical protein
MELIFTNAMTFNEKNSIVYQAAFYLLNHFRIHSLPVPEEMDQIKLTNLLDRKKYFQESLSEIPEEVLNMDWTSQSRIPISIEPINSFKVQWKNLQFDVRKNLNHIIKGKMISEIDSTLNASVVQTVNLPSVSKVPCPLPIVKIN